MRIAKLLKKTKGLKTATKIELLFLMRVFSKLAYQPRFSLETARCALVANALRCEIAFSAIQKLKLFSLLKIKEGLKTATEIVRSVASPSCYRVFARLQDWQTKTLVAHFNASFEKIERTFFQL